MKKFNEAVRVCSLVLLCSLLLSSCFELNPFNSDNNIRFVGTYGMPETRVSYGDVIEGDDYDWQQIVWELKDTIRIVSDIAYNGTGNKWADYFVTSVDNDRNNKKSSFANIAAVGEDGLKWETDGTMYQFWAAYPADILNTSSKKIRATPNDMPLIAYNNCSYSSDNMVVLQFHPCFTALEFDITTAPGVSGVEITNCEINTKVDQYLTGEFSGLITKDGITNVALDGDWKWKTAEPGITNKIGSGKSFTFFCLPVDIKRISLTCTFKVDGVEHSKSIVLEGENGSYAACKKHVTSLVLNSTVDDDFELSRGGSQILASFIWDILGNSGTWAALQEYLKDEGIEYDWQFLNKYWNRNNDHANMTELMDRFSSMTYDDLIDVFGEEALDILLRTIYEKEEVSLNGHIISSTITAKDLRSLCPNVKKLQLKTTDTVTVNIEGLLNLQTAELLYVRNANFSGCPSLTSVKISDSNNLNSISIDSCRLLDKIEANVAGKLSEIKLVNTPKFREGNISNVNQPVDVTLINCSTEVTSATLSLNGRGNVIVRTNSSNVTVK